MKGKVKCSPCELLKIQKQSIPKPCGLGLTLHLVREQQVKKGQSW
jgi:hypothetical protein